MANNIEVVSVTLSDVQQRAVRKLALRSSKLSASEMATSLLSQVIRGRFKAVAETIAEDAASKYDMAVSNGFTPPMEKKEFVSKARAEYNEILAEL
jgi:hypothetical protein